MRPSDAHIVGIYDAAIAAGARAGKAAGSRRLHDVVLAPDRRMGVIHTPWRSEGPADSCHFAKHGTQAWRI